MATIATGIFAGMDTSVLETWLPQAQLGLIELQAGVKNISLSYTQGDGAKSVTKRVSSVAECTALIQQMQMALGIVCRPRRSIRFIR